MTNLDSIFAPQFNMDASTTSFKREEFLPNAKNGKNGEYKAVIRFVPWHVDPEHPIITKVQAFVVDPTTNRGRTIDSPRSVNQQCPIVDMFWNLMNTQRQEFKDIAKKCLSSYTVYTALVQIISDEQHPENVGKILPWRFKKTIWDKIYNEMHPQMGKAYNPFDIINGRYFSIKVTLKSGFNNYDNCLFFDYQGENGETSGMWFKNTTGNFEIVTAHSDRQVVYDYLVANTPDMTKYQYNEWTEDDSRFVNNVLNTLSSYANLGTVGQAVAGVQNVATNVGGYVQTTPSAPVMPTPVASSNVGMPAMPQMPTPAAPAVNVPTMSATPNVGIPEMPSMPSMPQAPTATANITGVDVPETVVAPKVNPATQTFNLGNLPMTDL